MVLHAAICVSLSISIHTGRAYVVFFPFVSAMSRHVMCATILGDVMRGDVLRRHKE